MLWHGSVVAKLKAGHLLFSKVLLPLALAFSWHSVDALLSHSKPRRRVKSIWTGIGVGWSLYWLIKHLIEPQVLVVTTPLNDPPQTQILWGKIDWESMV